MINVATATKRNTQSVFIVGRWICLIDKIYNSANIKRNNINTWYSIDGSFSEFLQMAQVSAQISQDHMATAKINVTHSKKKMNTNRTSAPFFNFKSYNSVLFFPLVSFNFCRHALVRLTNSNLQDSYSQFFYFQLLPNLSPHLKSS